MRYGDTENRIARALARLGGRPPSASLARALLAPYDERHNTRSIQHNRHNAMNRSTRPRARNNEPGERTNQMSDKKKIVQLISHIVTAILSGLAGFFGTGL